MKKLFATFLSLQLILSPVAFAAGEEPASVSGTEELASSYQGNTKNGGYDFYTKQVLGIGISAVGTGIISKCLTGLKVPSIAVFMGGSLVHIASEVLGGKLESEAHKKKLKDIKLVEENLAKGGEVQKEALIQRKKDEEQTRDFIKKRILWTTAIMAIYGTSMGLSILEASTATTAFASSMATGCATVAAACYAGYAACYAACAGQSIGALASAQATGNSTGLAVGTSSCGPNVACTASVSSYHAIAYGACTPAPSTSAFSWTGLLGLAYGFGASKVGDGAISQYGGMLMTLLPMVVKGTDVLISTTFSYPIQRAITMGSFTALTGVVLSGLIVRKKIAEDNIKKLDRVLAKFEAETATKTGVQEDGPGVKNPPKQPEPVKPKDMNMLASGATPKNCISKNGSNFDLSEKSCSGHIKLTPTKFDFGGSVPTLVKSANLSTDLSNALAAGDTAKAELLAGELGSMAGRIKEVNDNLQKAYNDEEKKNGKDGVKFEEGIKSRVAQLEKDIAQAASSNSNLAALTGETQSPSSASSADKQEPDRQIPNPPVVEIPQMNSMSFSEDSTVEEVAKPKTASLSDSLEEYESSEQDISNKSDVSIFKQVSNRYLLNYTRIFEKKKTLDESK